MNGHRRLIKTIKVLLISIAMISCCALTALAQSWEYRITGEENIVNMDKTNAVVDTTNNEIRLPKINPSSVSFWNEEDSSTFDYVAFTPDGVIRYMFDGTSMVPVKMIDSVQMSNPVSALACSPMPDMMVAEDDGAGSMKVTQYSFTGTDWASNPSLAVQGLTNIISIESRDLDKAVLTKDGMAYYAFDGSSMVAVPALSVGSGLTSPIDVALLSDSYNSVIIDGRNIKYYESGSLISTLEGISGAVSISAADGGNIGVVAGNSAKHFNIIGGTLSENSALSITSGLTAPTCVALKKGTYDRLIVDGNEIKYYSWDGTQLQYNPSLSVMVSGLKDMGFYIPQAVAESVTFTPKDGAGNIVGVTNVKVEAVQNIPVGTEVKWYVTATDDLPDLSNWKECILGEYQQVEEGSNVRWRAVLSTSDRGKTPVIKPIIIITVNVNPSAPIPDMPSPDSPDPEKQACYATTTPKIRWQFVDPDTGDYQSAFQVVVSIDAAGLEVVEDSGKVMSTECEYTIDENATGKLWNTGESYFYISIKVWDSADAGSVFSTPQRLCVIAFDRPMAKEIVMPPATDILIDRGAGSDSLPISKAGGLVTMEVNSLGVNSCTATFTYGAGKEATIAYPPSLVEGVGTATNKRWTVSMYTDANTDICPNNTIVGGILNGNGVPLIYLKGTQADFGPEPDASEPKWWNWFGYRWWAQGLVKIQSSAFSTWSVVLEGRN